MPLTIHTNNLISLGNAIVGRVDKTTCASKHRPTQDTTFFTSKGSDRTNLSTPHSISEPTYIGGPAEWRVNPKFEARIRAIVDEAKQ